MKKKEVLVISGISGGGKSTMAKALEDLGFFVVDNLPAELLGRSIALIDEFNKEANRLAFVIDAREQNFLKQFPKYWLQLKRKKHNLRLFFLDCLDETIVKRYKETRRRHPLERGKGIRDGIKQERVLLDEIKNLSDEIIVTDKLNAHELKNAVKQRFENKKDGAVLVTLLSFGFKHGLPNEIDLCFDSRFLKNPFFIEELKPLTGLDKKVSNYVLSAPHAKAFLKRLKNLIEFLIPLYQKEGKSYITIAIGCTGGQHRSVALVNALNKSLQLQNALLRVEHRDSNRR